MGRSEQRMQERRAAEERRVNAPAPTAAPKPARNLVDQEAARRGRGAGFTSRRSDNGSFIDLGTRSIATPGGGSSNSRATRGGGGLNTGTGSRDAPAPETATPRPSRMPNLPSDYKETELEAGRTAEAHRPGAGFSPSGRGDTRTSPTGVQQKGTDMSGANALLASLGIDTVKYGQFESNNLPGGETPVKTEGKTDTDATLTGQTTNQVASDGSAGDNTLQKPTDETNIVNQGFALGSKERYNQEFLKDRGDAIGGRSESMVGLRAAEASKGLLYASGKYWQEDGNGGFKEIDKATYKSIKRGDSHAQSFANAKIDELTQNIGNKSNTYTVETDAKPTLGTDIDYAVPDAADMPEGGTIDLNTSEVPTNRVNLYKNAFNKKQK